MFSRRETLDIAKMSNRLATGYIDDKSTRNSELRNACTSDDNVSIQYCSSPRFMQSKTARNDLIVRKSNNSSIEPSRVLSKRSGCWACSKAHDNESSITRKKIRSDQKQLNNHFRSVHVHNNWFKPQSGLEEYQNISKHTKDDRKSIEKELYNQVSNVVSSFFSRLDSKPNHCRQKSKSDLGFAKPANQWMEYKCSWKDSMISAENNNKIKQSHNFFCDNTDDQSINLDNNHTRCNCHRCNSMLISENVSSDDENLCQSKMYTPQHHNQVQWNSYSSNKPFISQHLVGLNSKVRKEVSPINHLQDPTTYLLNSGTSLFDSTNSNPMLSQNDYSSHNPKYNTELKSSKGTYHTLSFDLILFEINRAEWY